MIFSGGQENGSGRRQNIAESLAKIFANILSKFPEFKISPNLQH